MWFIVLGKNGDVFSGFFNRRIIVNFNNRSFSGVMG